MKTRRAIGVLTAALAVGVISACAKPALPDPGPHQDLIVLLPDDGSGTAGRATVSNAKGHVDLAEAGDSTRVAPNKSPMPVASMSDADVRRMFGKALAALPPPPQAFTLFFRFDSEELTDESRKTVRNVLRSVKQHPFPDVVVLGHTDTTGTRGRNLELGLKRASMVRALLVETGLDDATIEVVSHGERELLVQTGDEVFEPRNRRVEILVR
jgi:outer membrane protein OmpA-like peptidoglycan-associated protein